jgi:DNA sulfur modification protein DndD
MRIKSLKLVNFRAFHGEQHEIEFAHEDDQNLTLILAENEVGKSTILNAFLWCLYGNLTEDTHLPEKIVHDDARSNRAEVEVRLIEDDQEYLFKRILNKGQITFKAFPIDDVGQPGTQIQHPQRLIESFLPRDLSDFFFFNGEGLTDITKEPEVLNRSIQDIQGLTAAREAKVHLDNFISDLGSSIKRTGKKADLVKGFDQKITDQRSEETKIKGEIVTLEGKQKTQTDLERKAKKAWENLAPKSGKKLQEDKRTAIKAKDNYKNLLDKQILARGKLINEHGIDILAHNFLDEAISHLAISEEKGYPSKYTDTMINDSLAEGECTLCENKLDKNTIKLLNDKLAFAIDDDLKDRVRKTRTQIATAKRSAELFHSKGEDIANEIQKLENFISEELKKVDVLQGKIDNLGDIDDEIKKAQDKWDEEAAKLHKINVAIAIKRNDLKEASVAIIDLKRQRNKVAPDEDPAIAYQKDFLQSASSELETLITDAEKEGRNFIFHHMNESLKEHSKGNHEFRFEKDTYTPQIVKRDGKLLALSKGGLKLKKNLFFVSSLIQHSKKRADGSGELRIPGVIAPMVVDAPFSDLDSNNVLIAARVLLESSDQLIVMISSASFNGGFLNALSENNNKYKKRLGKAYCVKRHFSGTQDDKDNLQIKAFNQTVDTALYDAKFDTSEIEELAL